jgi:hypothetical protein
MMAHRPAGAVGKRRPRGRFPTDVGAGRHIMQSVPETGRGLP